jgi:6-phosphogluconolactonase
MIKRFANPAALAVGMADLVETILREAIETRGEASIALAGGSTPAAFHRELATRALDWPRVHVWFGDERCVPPDDHASNYRMARETLTVDAVWHRIEAERGGAEAAKRYAVTLPLDVVVLGMGDDGHTASIFPETPPLDGLVAATSSPFPPHERVTLTLMAIRGCRNVIMQVQGAGKAARLAEVYAQMSSGAPTLPAAQLGPVTWMIDEAAGQLLPWSDA